MAIISRTKAMTLLKDFKTRVATLINDSKQTKLSDIETQDGGFVTADGVSISISEDAKQYLTDQLSNIISFTTEQVTELPALDAAKEKVIYLLPAEDSVEENLYEEYLLVNGKWEIVGKETIDLSKYDTSTQINEKIKTIEESNTEITDDEVDDIIAELWDRKDTYKYEVVLSDDGSYVSFSKTPEYVDWGDGSKELSDHHEYSKAGTYVIQSTQPIISGQDIITKVLRIPEGVTNGRNMFNGYTKLTTVAKFPSTLTDCTMMFNGCTSLVKIPKAPSGATCTNMYAGCTALTSSPAIPEGAICTMMFNGTGLTTAPAIPDSVLECGGMFSECSSLTDISAIYSYIEKHYDDSDYDLVEMFHKSENITIPDTAANIKAKYPKIFG